MRGLAAIALAIGTVGGVVGPAGAASAVPADPQCNNNNNSSWDGWGWTPDSGNSLLGIRAPVKLRTDGLLCINSSNSSTSSVWIAIQEFNANSGIQIGFLHKFVSGVGEWCRFYEDSSIAPQAYYCQDGDSTQVYFKVEKTCSPTGTCGYAVYDCGTGGDFTDCGSFKDEIGLFTSPEADVNSEAHNWCDVRMMGQGGDRVWYGNSTWATSIDDNSGWSKNRSYFDYGGNQCTSSYLKDNAGGGLLRTWDSRNTS